MKRQAQLAIVLLAALALTTAAAAQDSRVYREGNTWVEETTGTLPAAAQLRVHADIGTVRVQGGQSTITYVVRKRAHRATSEAQAREIFQGYRLRATRQGEAALLRGECATRGACQGRVSIEYDVQGPRELQAVNVQTSAGSVSVNNIAGRVEAKTHGGSISLGEIGGLVRAATMGGSINLKSAGADAELDTAGGHIEIGSVKGRVTARTHGGSVKLNSSTGDAVLETAGGSISVIQCGGQLDARTAGGSLEIGRVSGPVTLSTAGGNIRLSGAGGPVTATTAGGVIHLSNLAHGARVETAAGPIRAHFVGGSFSESSLLTSVGDVTVTLPSDLPVTVRAAIHMASGHRIRSDFPELRISSDDSGFGPREVYGEGDLNGGGPVLRVRTTMGNITLVRAKK